MSFELRDCTFAGAAPKAEGAGADRAKFQLTPPEPKKRGRTKRS